MLYPHQNEAIDFIISKRTAILNLGMGYGKTRIMLDFMAQMKGLHIVVAPKSVCPNWVREMKKHGYSFNYWLVTDGSNNQIKMRNMRNFVDNMKNYQVNMIVVNFDMVHWVQMWTHPSIVSVIVDEAHYISDSLTKRFRSIYSQTRRIPYRVALTGTLYRNNPLSVYGIVKFVNEGIFYDDSWKNKTTWSAFRDRYGVVIRQGNIPIVVGYKNLDDLYRRVKELTFTIEDSRLRNDMGFPEVIEIAVDVPAKTVTKRIYKDMAKKSIAHYEYSDNSVRSITADNPLVKAIRLKQISNGTFVFDDGAHVSDLNKVEVLNGLLESTEEQIVVFYSYEVDRLKMVENCNFTHSSLCGKVNTLEEWQRGETKILFVQYQAGSSGIDLSRAKYGIFFDPTYSVSDLEQAKARLVRPGGEKDKIVILYHLYTLFDYVIRDAQNRKIDLIKTMTSGELEYFDPIPDA